MANETTSGLIPNLTRLFFGSIRTGAAWVTETFIQECQAVVRASVGMIVALAIAVVLIKASFQWDSTILLVVGVVIGAIGGLYFLVRSTILRIGAKWLAQFSIEAQQEIENFSNIVFMTVVTVFYLIMDHGQRHPKLLTGFLVLMFLFFVDGILPARSKLMTDFKAYFRILVSILVISMAFWTVIPEAIAARIINSHGLEEATGTFATEIPFRIDEQDQIIDLTTNQPMELFARISSKGEPPKARKGWTRDKKGNYHFWTWFDGQANFTPTGQEIVPITTAKVEDIIIETKRATEQKIVDEKKTVDDQKDTADAEAAKLKAEADRKLKVQQDAQQVADENVRREKQERENLAETKRIARETAQEEQRQLALQPISVATTILESTDKSQDIVLVKPNEPFTYRKNLIQPEQSVVVLDIVEVKETSDKNKYELILQPQTLMSAGQNYDISRQAEPIQITVRKDNSRKVLKFLSGAGAAAAGATIGAITGGKKGALIGAVAGGVAGTVYAMASHGKKFNLTIGDVVPPIVIRPIL